VSFGTVVTVITDTWIYPATVLGAATVPVPSASPTPGTVYALVSIPTPEPKVAPQPGTVAASATLQVVAIQAGSTAGPATVAGAAGVPAVIAYGAAGPVVGTVVASITVGAPSIFADAVVTVTTVNGTTTITGSVSNPATIYAATVAVLAALDTPVVTTKRMPFRGWGVPLR
jgi:hypothetical protein